MADIDGYIKEEMPSFSTKVSDISFTLQMRWAM